YVVLFRSGESKVRGIEARRSDTPPFIRRAQMEMLRVLSAARNRREYEALLPKVLEIFEGYRERLRSGRIPFTELAISKSISQSPEQYQKESVTAIVAKELVGRGVHLSPGQSIAYVITDHKARVKSDRARALGFIDGTWGYDLEKYEDLLDQATRVFLLEGHGSKAT
ncbi:MAG TPA: DNA polymerase domain-containing protein, partial [Nitrospiria bacterium]|nr:DNA polymerase domain-containing protein [Nitrospiria bacterium]